MSLLFFYSTVVFYFCVIQCLRSLCIFIQSRAMLKLYCMSLWIVKWFVNCLKSLVYREVMATCHLYPSLIGVSSQSWYRNKWFDLNMNWIELLCRYIYINSCDNNLNSNVCFVHETVILVINIKQILIEPMYVEKILIKEF